MAADYDRRLNALRDRRQGISTLQKSLHAFDSREASRRAGVVEQYERRPASKASRYALGSMQAVDAEYTANSVAQGDRVRNQLERGHAGDIPVTFEYQGSVPLDVHIRGVSDIDLLVLRGDFITIERGGSRAHLYEDWPGDDAVTLLRKLRSRSEAILAAAFPEATVGTAGSKSIALEGGSLRRKVDVVPSHWHDSSVYQTSLHKKDRGVYILDKHAGVRTHNLPFMHIHQVNLKDAETIGGTKKAIRLLKNLRSDSDFSESIKLSSYDIAGLVWHFSSSELALAPWHELRLLDVVQRHLAGMISDKARAMALRTPDGTRCVLDSEDKFRGMVLLGFEVNQLCEAVAGELAPFAPALPSRIQRSLQESYVAL